ncbi:hypothetical protein Tco_1377603 [Tanacetum coccineum]
MPRRSILSFSDFSPATYVAGKKRAGERGFCCSTVTKLVIRFHNTYLEGSPCQPRIDASMGQNPTDSHLEGKPLRRDSNLRPLACGNNLPKNTLGGQLR